MTAFIARQPGDVPRREPPNLLLAALVVLPQLNAAPVLERHEHAAGRRRPAEPVALEIELPHHQRMQQAGHVGAGRHADPGPGLLERARASHLLARLEHQHPPSRAREIGRASEAVVSGSDDDHVPLRAGERAHRVGQAHTARAPRRSGCPDTDDSRSLLIGRNERQDESKRGRHGRRWADRRPRTGRSVPGEQDQHAPEHQRPRRPRARPIRHEARSFSRSTNPASTATHTRFITPATNRSAMSSQQQPTQKVPCRTPMTSAPPVPSRQLCRENVERRPAVRQARALGGSH